MAFVKLADNYTDLIGKFAVALREEGVDRNLPPRELDVSPHSVALREEGVDRNQAYDNATYPDIGRPPRGGRG